MHWGIAYLREDIQDLRSMIVRLEAKFEDRFNRQDGKFEDRFNRQDGKFEEIHRVIREQGKELTQRMMVLVGVMTTILLAAIKM